ncbi:hypothetical protein WN48_08008 [Eufriesea mexicana]|nr:hypothetical protein WN48_08008 [Eufriesea mexicana]
MEQFKHKTICKARSEGSDGDSDTLSENQMAKKPIGGVGVSQNTHFLPVVQRKKLKSRNKPIPTNSISPQDSVVESEADMPQTSKQATPALSVVSFCRKLEGEISSSSKSFLVENASELPEYIMELQKETKCLMDEIASLEKQLSDKTKVEDKIKLLNTTLSSAVQEFVDLKLC